MEIQYHREGGPMRDPCWKIQEHGTDPKGKPVVKEVLFKRVAAGVAIPKPDQPQGCAIVLAEDYRAAAPPTFTALGARVGSWPELERGLGALRREFKMAEVLTEPEEEALDALDRVPGLRWGSEKLPLYIFKTLPSALGEIGRQKVDELILEKRLDLKAVRDILDQASDQGARALQCVLIWLLENAADYEGPREPRKYGKLLGELPWP